MQMTVREALNSALDEEMSADSKIFLMGEEVLMEIDTNNILFFLCMLICLFTINYSCSKSLSSRVKS
jgi:uncharacterized Fe-S radical SAM superfamily protein PflX